MTNCQEGSLVQDLETCSRVTGKECKSLLEKEQLDGKIVLILEKVKFPRSIVDGLIKK